MKPIHNLHELMFRRRELRQRATTQEAVLWEYLRNKNIGYKFRRQHSIDYYIVDFYCPSKMLIVEIDGEQHKNPQNVEYDKLRDTALNEMGYKVLRIQNSEIDGDVKGGC